MATYPQLNTPPRAIAMDDNRDMQQRMLPDSPWELQLEEGEQVTFEAAFLKDNLVQYWKWAVILPLICIPIVGWIALIPALLTMCIWVSVLTQVADSYKCVVTTRSLYYYKSTPGCCCCCWGHEQRYIPLDKVQDINISQSWLQKKFNVYQVKVETAGQSGSAPEGRQPEGLLVGMADPMGFRQALMSARLGVAPQTDAVTAARVAQVAAPAVTPDAVQIFERIEEVLRRVEENTRAQVAPVAAPAVTPDESAV